MSDDPFISPKSMLRRAKDHIGDFETKIAAFVRERDWNYVIEQNIDRRTESHKIKFGKAFFEEAPSIAFDIVTNLRSALDQSGYASAVAAGAKKPKSAYFPIGDSAAALENVIARRCKNLPPEIITLFRAFKPYLGGNYFIPALNQLCNVKKHAVLIPLGLDRLGVQVKIGGAIFGLPFEWDAAKYEIKLVGVGRGTNYSRGGEFAFTIAFNHEEPRIGGSEPLALIRGMAREVERVVLATEAECRRIGLIK